MPVAVDEQSLRGRALLTEHYRKIDLIWISGTLSHFLPSMTFNSGLKWNPTSDSKYCGSSETAKQGLPIRTTREAMLGFADSADVVAVSVALVAAATRRVETSGLSFWDSLIIESAIDTAACRLWTEDLQNGQVFDDLVVVNPFV